MSYQQLRRSAKTWTTVLALPFTFLVAQLVYSAAHHETTGAFVFFMTGVYAIPATLVLCYQWRRTLRTRPETSAAVRDPETGPHRVLSGEQPPPTRW